MVRARNVVRLGQPADDARTGLGGAVLGAPSPAPAKAAIPTILLPTAHIITQLATGLFGVREDTIQRARIVEFKYAQGAKPGLAGTCLGSKVTPVVAAMREVVEGRPPLIRLSLSTASIRWRITRNTWTGSVWSILRPDLVNGIHPH